MVTHIFYMIFIHNITFYVLSLLSITFLELPSAEATNGVATPFSYKLWVYLSYTSSRYFFKLSSFSFFSQCTILSIIYATNSMINSFSLYIYIYIYIYKEENITVISMCECVSIFLTCFSL